MKSKAFTHRSRRKAQAGFSLVELLVTLFIASAMMVATASFFSVTVATTHDMELQTETQQGLRALFSLVTQELRQAGACLPENGQFIALDGANSGDQDSFTLRIGQTNPDTLACIRASTDEKADTGDTVLSLASGQGSQFAGVSYVYVTPNGATGDFYGVVAQDATSITLDTGLSVDHPAGSGIYAVEERTYEIETLNERPVLTVAMDGGSAQPLVDGVEKFNIRYLLAPCTLSGCAESVDLPADNAEWAQVRQVEIAAEVSSRKERRDGQLTVESGEIVVKPRNLL